MLSITRVRSCMPQLKYMTCHLPSPNQLSIRSNVYRVDRALSGTLSTVTFPDRKALT